MLDVSEAYTTKTVSWTGEMLEGLGGASVVVAQDGERMDRDYNGARGIYLRALGDIPALRALLSECAASANNSCLSGYEQDCRVSPARKFLDDSTFIKEFLSAQITSRLLFDIRARPRCQHSPPESRR